jgi:glycosyltransferase involved in cell wall biosynthesis
MNQPAAIPLTIIMPALNEEKNVGAAIRNTLRAFDDCAICGTIIVVNDGSTDRTGEIITEAMRQDARVSTIRHERPRGIGASFWEGVEQAAGQAVCMLPGDNENDPWEIFQYYSLLQHVDIVIPFVFNKQVRSVGRNILSQVYRFIINTTFGVNFNYTNGTILWRRSVLRELRGGVCSTGFFFQTDALIRLVKKGYLFAEVPYRLGMRKIGNSKAVSFPSFVQVARGYLRLVRDVHGPRFRRLKGFRSDSATLRRQGDSSHVLEAPPAEEPKQP